MAIEKVTLVYIEGNLRKISKTLTKCCESGAFHINPPPDTSGTEFTAKNLKDKGVYERMIKRTKALAESLGVKLDENSSYDDIEYTTPTDFKKYLDSIDKMQSELSEEKLRLNGELRAKAAIYHNLLRFSGLDADISELLTCRYVKARFGRIPNGSMRKLAFYEDRLFSFYPFESKENFTWCLYLTPADEKNSIDYLFNSLGFERTVLPDYLKGNSDQAAHMLLEEMDGELARVNEIEEELKKIADKEGEKLSKVYAKLRMTNSSYELRTNVTVFDSKFHFSGYIPTKEKKRFSELMDDVGDITVSYRETTPDDSGVPVILKNNRLFRPFEMFVKMYGLPAANGIDPTPIVAITYMLLYGMMFGDVGQGICIILLGLLLTKFTKFSLAPILTRIGFSSTIFGFVYGSVFGNEELLKDFAIFRFPPIYSLFYKEAPENVFQASTLLLIMALLVGVALIIMTMIINIFVSLKMRDYESGIFGASGICGMVLYTSLVAGFGCTIALDINLLTPAYIICLIGLPILLIFFKEPLLHQMETHGLASGRNVKKNGGNIDTGLKAKLAEMDDRPAPEKKSVGIFIIEGFIDIFETCLTFLSNTMSYLRIGGFILSHAGLMLVFSIISEMFDGVGGIIVMIFGNIFVTGFEGFIVGIQVLRLEFYELFSRYFKSGGIPFKSVSMSTKIS